VTLTHNSFANMTASGRLIRLVKEAVHRLTPEGRPIDYEADERSVAEMEKFSAECKDVFRDGLPHLYQMATVSLWAILEASVDDLCASHILQDDRWTNIEALRNMKGPLLEFATAKPDARAEMLIESLKVQVRAPLKVGVGRFEEILDAVGLGGPVDDEIRRLLLELVERRNLLVHRGGVIDRGFKKACPWIDMPLGAEMKISARQYRIFYFALSWYQMELIRRVTVAYKLHDVAAALDGQREFVAIIQKLQATSVDESPEAFLKESEVPNLSLPESQ